MEDTTGLRNNYTTIYTKQPLANNMANMLESARYRHQALNHFLIALEIEQFMIDHLRITRPNYYIRYRNGGLRNVTNSKGLRASLINLP